MDPQAQVPGQVPADSAAQVANTAPITNPADAPADPVSEQQPTQTARMTPEQYEDALKKARSDAASYRTRLANLEKAAKDREDAELSEFERTKKRLSEVQAERDTQQRLYQERLVRYEVQIAASRLGIVDPDAAARLLDWSALEFDEDGTPKNADALLKSLVAARPWLSAPTQPAPSTQPAAPVVAPANPARSTQANGTITASQYLDPAYRAQYQQQTGMDIMTAVNRGIVKIV